MEGKILFVSSSNEAKKIGTPMAIGGRTIVLDTQKIAAPKKNSTFANDFFVFLFFGNLKL
jgi:hypothetical protein